MASEGRMEDGTLAPEPGPDPRGAEPTAAADPPAPGHLEDVARALGDDPRSFRFFQAVRLLERLRPEGAPVGGDGDPDDEVVRFSANPSLAFPSSEVEDIDLEGDGPARMTVNFMGLVGPQGMLPHHYTLLVMERLRRKDHALRAFLDIFQHRALSLFYRAWERNRFPVTWEKRGDDPLTEHLLDLVGMGTPALRATSPIPERTLACLAGLLAAQPRGALALEELIEEYFDVPCEVEQFVGGWYRLEPGDVCVLGDEQSPASRLGLGAVAGDEVWDAQARARIRIGPLDQERFDSFLPTGDAYGRLRDVLRFFSHDQVEFEVQLVLAREDVPGLVVGGDGPSPLGWSTWIRTEPLERDADGTILFL